MTDYSERRARLMDSLDVDAFLVVNLEATDRDGPSMRYLTGYPGFGVLMVTEDAIHAYASRTNIDMASSLAPHLDWRVLDWDYQNVIVSLLKEHGFGRVGLASRRIGMLTWRALESAGVCAYVIDEDPVGRVREIKDADEVATIRRATQITEASLESALRSIRPGVTEAEIAWLLEREMRDRGAQGLAFDLIVSAAERTAMPHHVPDDRPIRMGDLLLFDIGARVDGYCADLTRVVSVGRPTEEMREIYRIVLEANRAGIASFKPGVAGVTVDRAAREVIERAGYGEQYTHGLSHGVGIEVHELPVSEGARAVPAYKPGMVCTAEPGIYLSGVGGIRIEDLVVITDGGCDVLTEFPKDELLVVG
jgi:Xaa-Pro aminopeptidase